MTIEEIMTANPASIAARSPVRAAIWLMRDQDIRHVPVIDDGELVGMISDRDVRSYLLPALVEFETPVATQDLLRLPVSELMKTDVVTVSTESDVRDVIDLMLEQKVGAIPVVDDVTNTLEGIVSYVDILRAARAVL